MNSLSGSIPSDSLSSVRRSSGENNQDKLVSILSTIPKNSFTMPAITSENFELSKELVKAGGNDLALQGIASPLKRAGYLSTAVSGVPAALISTGAYFAGNIVLAKFAGLPLAVIIGGIALIGGMGYGVKEGMKKGEDFLDKGIVIAGVVGLGYAMTYGVYYGVTAAATGVVLGMTAPEWMSQIASCGVWDLSLMATRPLAQAVIAKPAIAKAEESYSNAQKVVLQKVKEIEKEDPGLPFDAAFKVAIQDSEVMKEIRKEKDLTIDEPFLFKLKEEARRLKALEDFANKPLEMAFNHWYNTLYDPPIHEDLKTYFSKAKQELGSFSSNQDTFEKIEKVFSAVLAPIQYENLDERSLTIDQGVIPGGKSRIAKINQTMGAIVKASKEVWKSAENKKIIAWEYFASKDQITEEQAKKAISKLAEIANKGGYESAASAWCSFDKIKALCKDIRKDVPLEVVRMTEARVAITKKYGPRPTVFDELFRGGKDRIEAIKKQLNPQGST